MSIKPLQDNMTTNAPQQNSVFRFLGTMTVVLIIFFSVIFILGGCSSSGTDEADEGQSVSASSESEPINLVIIYGRHANSSADITGIGDLDKLIEQVVKTEGFLGIVRLDGDPEIVGELQVSIESKNSSNREKEIANDVQFITNALQDEGMNAQVSEVDVVQALKCADNCFNKADDPDRENIVVIVDPGISTTGLVNFTEEGMTEIDPEDFLTAVVDQKQMPDLSRIDEIYWFEFGAVESPQTSFADERLSNMESIYVTLLAEACGIPSESIVIRTDTTATNGLTDEERGNLPTVQVVDDTGKHEIVLGNGETIPEDVILDETNSDIRFKTNTTDFENEQAGESLNEYADKLKDNPDLHVDIIGYTDTRPANYYDGGNQQLSLDRAMRVRDLLLERGVSENQIGDVTGGGEIDRGTYEESRCVDLHFSISEQIE